MDQHGRARVKIGEIEAVRFGGLDFTDMGLDSERASSAQNEVRRKMLPVPWGCSIRTDPPRAYLLDTRWYGSDRDESR